MAGAGGGGGAWTGPGLDLRVSGQAGARAAPPWGCSRTETLSQADAAPPVRPQSGL